MAVSVTFREVREMKRLVAVVLAALLLVNATGCILLAKPAVERVKERGAQQEESEEEEEEPQP
jgi:hypothetical protein